MADPVSPHCLQIFFGDMQSHGVWPMLHQKQAAGFRHLSKQEATMQISQVMRGLEACGIKLHNRVAFYGAPSIELWISEWAVLASGYVAVLIPESYLVKELVETLEESKSKIVFVERLGAAREIAAAAALLPDVTHLVCFESGEGVIKGKLPILSWDDLTKLGPDQPGDLTMLGSDIDQEDDAILFHYKDREGNRKAKNYTHALLLEHAKKMDELIAHQTVIEKTAIAVKYRNKGRWQKFVSYAKHVKADRYYIRNLDVVLCAVRWEEVADHIIGYYVPLLKGASLQIVQNKSSVNLAEYRPHVIIGEAQYLDSVKDHITRHFQKSGKMKEKMFRKMLALGKQRYETTEKLNPLQRVQHAILRKVIASQVLKLMGGRLRLIIGVDEAAHYETQIFFHTFDIGFVELFSPHFHDT